MSDPTTAAKRRLQAATAALAIAQDNKRRAEMADDAAACALARAAAERDSAVAALRETERPIKLTTAEAERFFEALLNPPTPTPEAREAMRRSREMFGEAPPDPATVAPDAPL